MMASTPTSMKPTPLKAYAVSWIHMPDVTVMFAASNAGVARYGAFLMLMDTRRTASIIEMRSKRAPEWDHLAELVTRDGKRIFDVDAGAFSQPPYWEPR